MSPIYDFECTECHNIGERIESIQTNTAICSKCGSKSKKIISASGIFTANEDTPWIRTVLDVVSKDDNAPHVVAFRKNPTRSNYKAWMKVEGLRPMDDSPSGHGEAYASKRDRQIAEHGNARERTEAIMREKFKRRSLI